MRSSMSENARGINPTSSGGLGGADVTSDATISRWIGDQYNGDRDVQKVLGYPDLDQETALERYRAKYEYQDIAARIVDTFPEETWKNPPKVLDEGEEQTEFEAQANTLLDSTLTTYFRRLDKAQRLGEYGLMVLGFDDGQPLEEPVNESAIARMTLAITISSRKRTSKIGNLGNIRMNSTLTRVMNGITNPFNTISTLETLTPRIRMMNSNGFIGLV